MLDRFAVTPGRAAAVRVLADGECHDLAARGTEQFPAASLLKIPLALAAERALATGLVDGAAAVAPSHVRSQDQPGVLHTLVSDPRLSPADLLGLAVALSDNDSASWWLGQVGLGRVQDVLDELGCNDTRIQPAGRAGVGPLTGTTTATDVIKMLAAVRDDRYPLTAGAMSHCLNASRIPLGATDSDVAVAHKTGSLPGVAHDAAILEADAGTMLAVFLSEGQHDTLVTGYQMGMCTRELLGIWGLSVRRTAGLA